MEEYQKLKKEFERLKTENESLRNQLELKPPNKTVENSDILNELLNNIYLKSSNQGLWNINITDDLVIFNNKLAEILELEKGVNQLSNKELDDFILKEDLKTINKVRKDHIDKKSEFFEVDYRIRTRKGNLKWIHTRGKIISYSLKNIPEQIVGVTYDITESKKLEEKLRFEEEKYKSFFLNSPLGAFKSTTSGKLLEINKEFARLFGYSNIDEAVRKIKDIASSIYVNPKDRDIIVQSIKKKPGVHIFEIKFKKRDDVSFVGRLIAKSAELSNGDTIIEGHLEDISESKRIFDILVKSEEKFNQLASTINDVFWIIDSNYKLIFINKAFENVYGRKIEEILEDPNQRINWIHPEDKSRLQEIYKKKTFEKGPIHEFYRIVRPDGELRWIWGREYPIFDENGELYRVVGIMSDVTEQKLLENALLQSSKKISLLLEQTPLAYIEWNKNFEITNWNQAASEVYKYSAEEAIGANIIDLIVPSYNKEYFVHLFNDLIEQKGSTKSTNENIDKNGNIVICEWYNNALVDNSGEIIGLASIVQDISARLLAEKEVEYSQNFFNTTFNAIPDYIHVINTNLEIEFVNNAFQEFLRELKLPIAQKNIPLNEVFPFLKARTFREYRHVFETGEELNSEEFTRIRSDKIYTETRKTPVFEDGAVKYIVTTVRNVTKRVKTQQALLESEKRLKLAFDAANDGLWDFNPKTKEIYYFSPRWFTMLGYDATEFPHTYETWSNLLHPEERINVENMVWDFINNKKDEFSIEFRMRNKNGQYQWILARGDVVEFDETGFPIRMVGTHVDISENKKILNLLSHKEQQLSTLLENNKDSIVVLDENGIIKFAGNLEASIIGEPVTELVGYNYIEYIHEKDKNKFSKALNKCYSNSSKRINIEYRSALDTGELIYLEAIISNHVKTKGINGVVFNIRNITEKKIDELKKEELLRNQKVLSNTAQDFLQIRDKNEIYEYVADKISELVKNPIIFIGSYLRNQNVNEYSYGIEKYIEEIKTFIGEDPNGFSLVLNDQRKNLLLDKTLIEIKGGISGLTMDQIPRKLCKQIEAAFDLNKIYVIGIAKDDDIIGSIVIITSGSEEIKYPDVIEALVSQTAVALERISLENELRISKEAAEKADNLKSAFLANMSHEIRTPMNAILGFTDLIGQEDISDKEKLEFIDIINIQGQKLLRLINDIIDISKIESEQINIIVKQVNLNVFLKDLFLLYEPEVKKLSKNKIKLEIETSFSDNSANIFIDEIRLNQVFTNLINNAIKYSEKGFIKFGYKLKSNLLEFFVEDSGIGVPTELKETIFERFRQADDSNVRKYGGTGLGLAICKGIVENMRGNIWVESSKNGGSKFVFTIPYHPASEKFIPAKINYNYKEKYNWNNKKILIVEDDETSLLYLKTILAETSIKIISAVNGKKALKEFNKHHDIDLILIDIQLPEISGNEVVERIRKENKKVKIIMQTAYAMPDEERQFLKSGADDFITKPVKMTILKPLINYYLNLAEN
jgi:PAS domain S-box-containing protein